MPPKKLGETLSRLGVHIAALTDHDTVGGIAAFSKGFKGLVIPGIELSVMFENEDVHLLGYGFDFHNEILLERLLYYQEVRRQRIVKICDKLRELGFRIQDEEIFAAAGGAEAPGRPHAARVMMERGFVKSYEEAFQKYLGFGKAAYIPKAKMGLDEGIELIHQAQGLAVLAHPALTRSEAVWQKALEYPLDGIEVFHPSHNEKFSEELLQVCREKNLAVTGGSDYHGNWEQRDRLGEYGLSLEQWIAFKQHLKGKNTYLVTYL
jgi:3',5'-nucleoside bisphosphate phosphatase